MGFTTYAIIEGIVCMIVLAFGSFLANIYFNALPVNSSSPFYYVTVVSEYWPYFLIISIVALIAYVSWPTIASFMMMSSGQPQNRGGR